MFSLLIAACLPFGTGNGLPTGGDGSKADPYLIENVHDLQHIEDDLTAYYALTQDIDAQVTKEWNGGEGFRAIGCHDNGFSGSLDGRNFTISNLYSDTSGNLSATMTANGLFGVLEGEGRVENLNLEGVNVTGYDFVGGLIGRMRDGSVEKCAGGRICGEYSPLHRRINRKA